MDVYILGNLGGGCVDAAIDLKSNWLERARAREQTVTTTSKPSTHPLELEGGEVEVRQSVAPLCRGLTIRP